MPGTFRVLHAAKMHLLLAVSLQFDLLFLAKRSFRAAFRLAQMLERSSIITKNPLTVAEPIEGEGASKGVSNPSDTSSYTCHAPRALFFPFPANDDV